MIKDMVKETGAFYQNPFGQLLLQQVAQSDMGISPMCVYNAEEVRNQRRRYALEYIVQMSSDSIEDVEENMWSMNYKETLDNFAEYWSHQLIGSWVIRQCGRPQKIIGFKEYKIISEKFKQIFEMELEQEVSRPTTKKGNPKMILNFEGKGYMTEPHFVEVIQKAAAVVDLTVRLEAS